jgi:hypothetical protein
MALRYVVDEHLRGPLWRAAPQLNTLREAAAGSRLKWAISKGR